MSERINDSDEVYLFSVFAHKATFDAFVEGELLSIFAHNKLFTVISVYNLIYFVIYWKSILFFVPFKKQIALFGSIEITNSQ